MVSSPTLFSRLLILNPANAVCFGLVAAANFHSCKKELDFLFDQEQPLAKSDEVFYKYLQWGGEEAPGGYPELLASGLHSGVFLAI